MKKNSSTQTQSAFRPKKSASKGVSAKKRAIAGKSKPASTSMKPGPSTQRGAGATAPVVYQTLREKVAAVDSNIGLTRKLSDFLKSYGWS